MRMPAINTLNRERVRWAAIYVALIGWAILWSFPWKFSTPGHWPTDSSFTPLAHVFFAEGRPWGAHTLHTSGIWGFLRFPFFNPETFSTFVCAHVALGALIGWFVADRCFHLPKRRWILVLTGAALLPLLSASDDARWYIPIFGLVVLRALDRTRGAPSALVVALALGVSLAAHAKGNLFIAAGVVVVALLAADLLQRRIPWTVMLIFASGIVLLYAGGGDLAGFVRYTIHVLESTRAYPEAFSQSSDGLTAALFLLGVVFAGAARCLQVRYRWQWPLALAFGLLLFLLYKGAFVRQDAIHLARTVAAVVLVVGMETVAAFCSWSPTTMPRRRATIAGGLAIASLALFLSPLADGHVRRIVARELWTHPPTAVGFVKIPLAGHQDRLDRKLARIRLYNPFVGVKGSIATVGTFQSLLLAYGLHPETLPVVAHYEVWSPRAAAAIDRYLNSDEAPQYLVRTANYPSASNELSIARLYRPTGSAGFNYTLLERRSDPLVVRSETLFEGTVGWDEPIDIPSEHLDSLLVAEVRYHRNLAGRLVSFLHHPPHAQMILERSDGSRASVRLNSMLADQGIVAAVDVPDPEYGGHLQRRGVPGVKTIQDGHWGGGPDALHLSRHAILTEVESNVRRVRFRAETLGHDATALFKPELHVRIQVVSFTEAPQP
jgi:hypothetical protein